VQVATITRTPSAT